MITHAKKLCQCQLNDLLPILNPNAGVEVCTPRQGFCVKNKISGHDMGRPQNSEPRARSRKFSIVIHDVLPNDKDRVTGYARSLYPHWYLVALEEYGPDVPVKKTDHHIHLFIQHEHATSKWEHLKRLQKEFPNSRVQVDHGKGTFEECQKYLVEPNKDKSVDQNIIYDDRPAKARHHTMLHAHSKICKKTCSRCTYLRWYRQQLENGQPEWFDKRPFIDPIIEKQPANKLWM